MAFRLPAALVACALVVGSFPAARADDPSIVSTDKGPVQGIVLPNMLAFLGIPYAAPPVATLRWQPPQPHARWHGLLHATAFANHCPQPPSFAGSPSVTEDCLYLNVFTPLTATDDAQDWPGDQGAPHRHPVMVFIHGGFFTVGQSDLYIPSRLVADDVVVVTFNYRLGFLGFLSHPALSAESPDHASGNYAIMDQQFALRWVRQNIAQFGGDPDNVTLFGQSAGGLGVHTNLVSPTAAGLFQRAIVESGSYALTLPTLSEAEAAGETIAAQAGCTDQTAACLRALPVTTLLALQPLLVYPTVGGRVLPLDLATAVTSGVFNRVPVIEGTTHDEWRWLIGTTELVTGTPMTAADYIPAIMSWGNLSAPIALYLASFYPLANYSSPSVAFGALATDGSFACNARVLSRALSQYTPTYEYEFNDPTAPWGLPPVSFPTGAYHGAELQYLFDFTLIGFPALNAGQVHLADTIAHYWTHFARTGNPNSRPAVPWPRYGSSDEILGLVQPEPAPIFDFAVDHKCAVWGSP
jgi:para-nitrobenzyl esterase